MCDCLWMLRIFHLFVPSRIVYHNLCLSDAFVHRVRNGPHLLSEGEPYIQNQDCLLRNSGIWHQASISLLKNFVNPSSMLAENRIYPAMAILLVAGGQCSTIALIPSCCSRLISNKSRSHSMPSISFSQRKSYALYAGILSQPRTPGRPATMPRSRLRRFTRPNSALLRHCMAFVHSHLSNSFSKARERLTMRMDLIQARANGVRSCRKGTIASTCESKSKV